MNFYSEEYLRGVKEGYSPEIWSDLVASNPSLNQIFLAGVNWKNFDGEAGFAKLKEMDRTNIAILKAGKLWPNFPHMDAATYLMRQDINYGAPIVEMGWPISKGKKRGIFRAFQGRLAAVLLIRGVVEEKDVGKYITSSKWNRIVKKRKIQQANGGASKNVVLPSNVRKLK